MYFKFTEQGSEPGKILKYEAVLIEAMSCDEALEILHAEFPNGDIESGSFNVEEAKDMTRAKSLLDSAKSFIIIHSAKKVKDIARQ
ncbi:MAG TPA: hypothetical protein VHP30_03870 [Ignavibacteriales bacterium]|nr:hypothetical protein [Ignavibacteriales bacterium]